MALASRPLTRPPRQPVEPPGLLKRIQGRVVFIQPDGQEGVYGIQSDEGFIRLLPGGRPPVGDDGITGYTVGTYLALDCTTSGTGSCTSTSSTTLISAPATAPSTASKTMKVLAVLLTDDDGYGCVEAPGTTEAAVTSLYTTPGTGYAAGLANCSRSHVTVGGFTAVSYTWPNNSYCGGACDWWYIMKDFTGWAPANVPNYSSYTHRVYILPPSYSGYCGWQGLAAVGGNDVWLVNTKYGLQRMATVVQETMHNFIIRHGWRYSTEYQDYSTSMGYGDTCFSAPELARWSWATAVGGGGAVDSAVLPAKTLISFNVPALYGTATGAFLRITPNWMTGYGDSTCNASRNLYVSLRVARGVDAGLLPEFDRKVSVHSAVASVDACYPTTCPAGTSVDTCAPDPKYELLELVAPGSVSAGAGAIASTWNLVVYAGGWTDSGSTGGLETLRVHLCRFTASPAECPTWAAAEGPWTPPPSPPGPAPSPPSPLPPSPPSPKPPPLTAIPASACAAEPLAAQPSAIPAAAIAVATEATISSAALASATSSAQTQAPHASKPQAA
ncbi:hypothetical protein HYH02_014662 [Chlamydomonas schloesseri]|uniref:Peptidase M11 gametolysin domain-containing protein n=1 Tax=Chlamydomonas schloesseri TaxID=2026947 RepID=A0A835VVU0_9CHLO|nr:hypothetical protein HYH02_014662 [Chlamydomonas schloesseri]|eukprot:KAG2427016.1 hypothetical protein HYH02_014662 [Chlamydomonas schloesseri]